MTFGEIPAIGVLHQQELEGTTSTEDQVTAREYGWLIARVPEVLWIGKGLIGVLWHTIHRYGSKGNSKDGGVNGAGA